MNDCAITYTVNSIHDILISNISFHRKIGVKHFFVFMDNNKEEFPEELLDAEDVTCRRNVTPEELSSEKVSSRYLKDYNEQYNSRRMFNVMWASYKSREDGIGWIASIDPDELIICDTKDVHKNKIDEFLTNKSKYASIRMWTYEAHPYKGKVNKSFESMDKFVTFSHRSIMGLPFPFFMIRMVPHILIRRLGIFNGHWFGKAIFNIKYLDEYYPSVHSWHRIDSKTVKESLEFTISGNIFHYFHYDFDTYKDKVNYRNNRRLPISLSKRVSKKTLT